MEGKAALFNACADVQAIDIVIDQEDPDRFIQTVTDISPSFRGINHRYKSTRVFLYRTNISRKIIIPVFHDDHMDSHSSCCRYSK